MGMDYRYRSLYGGDREGHIIYGVLIFEIISKKVGDDRWFLKE